MSAPSSPAARAHRATAGRRPGSPSPHLVARQRTDPTRARGSERVGVLDDHRGDVGVDLRRLPGRRRRRTPPARSRGPDRTSGASRPGGGRRPRRPGPVRARPPAPCSPPPRGRSRRRRATRSRPRGPSARTPSTGTRTTPAGRPGTAPAGTACTRWRTRIARRAPRRPTGRSGRTRRRPRSTQLVHVPVAGRERPEVLDHLELEIPAGISSGPSRRTAGGIWSNRSSRDERPIASSISATSASVWGANFTAGSTGTEPISRTGPRARTSSPATGSPAGRTPCTGSPGTVRAAGGPSGSSSLRASG